MSDRDKDDSSSKEGTPTTPDRQGKKEGGTPDYEKGQSNSSLDKEFKESNWT